MKLSRGLLTLGRLSLMVLCPLVFISCTEELPGRPVSGPTVWLAGISEGDTLTAGQLQITAQVEDDGCVLFVTFYLDQQEVGVDSLPPFELTYDFTAVADDTTHLLAAIARDNDDQLGGFSVNFRVRNPNDETPPSVAFTSPTSGSAMEAGLDPIMIAAEDNVGVEILELSIDGSVVRADTLTIAQYPEFGYPAFTFNAWADGEAHSFTVRAVDSSGNEASSESIEITLTKPAALELSEMLTIAMPAWYNGHAFEHYMELDPAIEYTHAVEYEIHTSTCVRGFGALIDCLDQGCLLAYRPARFDIDHCIIVNGYRENPDFEFSGGTIEIFPLTEGSIVNCTFYECAPAALYLYETANYIDLRVINNIFYRNGDAGVVRQEPDNFIHIRYNLSSGHGTAGTDYATHCGCPESPPLAIEPTDPEELHQSNLYRVDPMFVSCPPPKPGQPCDFHLSSASPCLAAGENGEDLGALPYEGD